MDRNAILRLRDELATLRATTAQLEQDKSDLEIELQAAIEHGDAIEAELAMANDQMRGEISERIRAEAKLQRLLGALSEQKDDLELLVQTITEHSDDIDVERELANEQLRLENERIRLAKDHAETLSRVKAEFVAVVSHEVRTPMNGLLGMARLLLDTELTAEQRELAGTVVSSGQLLLTILDDILDLSKLEAGRLTLEQIDFDLVGLVEESLGLMSGRAAERGLAICHHIAAGLAPMAVGDPMRLRQVLTNLIGNATKFTEKGSIVVTVEQAGEAVRFAVTDSGIGIPVEVQSRLFGRYVQGDTWVSRKFGGTGLGLAICKQLVEMMGGRIGVASAPGEGSTFWFEVPLRRAGQQRPRRRPARVPPRVLLMEPVAAMRRALGARLAAWGVTVVEAEPASLAGIMRSGDVLVVGARIPRSAALALAEGHRLPAIVLSQAGTLSPAADKGDTVTLSEPASEEALATAIEWLAQPAESRSGQPHGPAGPAARAADSGPAAQPLTILVVEDNPVNQRVAVGMLARKGHTAIVAENGAAALAALRTRRFDLVLMDRHMPVMDGVETVRAIRALPPPVGEMPVVALTAAATRSEIEDCLAAGMDDFIPKPFSPEQLSEVIGRVMANRSARWDEAEFDPTVLAALRDALDEATVADILCQYRDVAETLSTDVAAAARMRDGEDLAFAAHSLKSASGQVGLRSVSSLCSTVETAIGEGRMDDAVELAGLLVQAVTRAQSRLPKC